MVVSDNSYSIDSCIDKAYRDLYTFHVMPWMRVCTVGVDLVNGLSSARVPEYVDEDVMVVISYIYLHVHGFSPWQWRSEFHSNSLGQCCSRFKSTAASCISLGVTSAFTDGQHRDLYISGQSHRHLCAIAATLCRRVVISYRLLVFVCGFLYFVCWHAN